MNPLYLELAGKLVGEDDVRAFEARHHCKLPDEYSRFLLRFNGGVPNPHVHVRIPSGRSVCLWEFYPLNDKRPYDLDRMCRSLEWEDGYALGYLKIARDPGGAEFFLSTKGDDSGKIYFLDREMQQPSKPALVEIASSFFKLLQILEPEDQR